MRAHVFQHVPFEYIGNMETWLRDRDYWITSNCFSESSAMPPPGDIDLLIIMGGPMSVNDELEHPWLKDEKWAITQYIENDVPIIGICLGAQLIAAACGAKVYPGAEKEIGWFPVHKAHGANDDLFAWPDELNAFHWHGDTFDLPEGATLLASSEGCVNQAFQIGRNVIGLQCHLETTPDSAASLVNHCREDMTPGRFVQDADEILAAPPERYVPIEQEMIRVLKFVTKQS